MSFITECVLDCITAIHILYVILIAWEAINAFAGSNPSLRENVSLCNEIFGHAL